MFVVHPKRFAVVKTDTKPNDFFAIVKTGDCLTAIIPEEDVNESFLEYEKGFRLITIIRPLSFKILKDFTVFLLSSDSADHVLIREEDLGKALEVLKDEVRRICKRY